MPADSSRGLLDTNILILRALIDVDELPEEAAISAVTLAELSAGPALVPDDLPGSDAGLERARRTEILQLVEHEFDPIPFDGTAARMFGRLSSAVVTAGRSPRRRTADLMIAATAAAEGLPLYTTNPDDFRGLDDIVEVVPITRPAGPEPAKSDTPPL